MRGTVGVERGRPDTRKREKRKGETRGERSEGQCNSLPNQKNPLSTIGLDAHESAQEKV